MFIKQIMPPQERWCKSQHTAAEGVRFFLIGDLKNPKANGIYCEICLSLATEKILYVSKTNKAVIKHIT